MNPYHCYCEVCDHCRTPIDDNSGHQTVYVGEADDNAEACLCAACALQLRKMIAAWCHPYPER